MSEDWYYTLHQGSKLINAASDWLTALFLLNAGATDVLWRQVVGHSVLDHSPYPS